MGGYKHVTEYQVIDALNKDEYLKLVHFSFWITDHRDEFIDTLYKCLAIIDNSDYLTKQDKNNKSLLRYLIKLNKGMEN